MSSETFDLFLSTLKSEVAVLAEENWADYRAAAIRDANDFIACTKADLERWTRMLASGDLTKEDFEWLVEGKKDLAELVALKKKGLSRVALDRFTNGLFDTILATALKTFL